jgi:hypothetical protein
MSGASLADGVSIGVSSQTLQKIAFVSAHCARAAHGLYSLGSPGL